MGEQAQQEEMLRILHGTEPADPEQVHTVQVLLAELAKTAKIFRTYPLDNAMNVRAVDALTGVWQSYLSQNPELELFVERSRLTFNSQTVYEEEDSRRSIALRLDRDGVRRLVFSEGITREEVVDLLTALTMELDEQSLDDDIVTVMWEKQFQHVKMFVLDELGSGSPVEEDKVDAGGTPSQSERTRTLTEQALWDAENMAYLSRACGLTIGKVAELSPEDMQVLKVRTESEKDRDISVDLEDVLFDMLRSGVPEATFDLCMRMLGKVVGIHLKRAKLDRASTLVGRMAGLRESVTLTEAELAMMSKTLGSALTPDMMREVARIVTGSAETGAQQVKALLPWISREALMELVGLLAVPACAQELQQRMVQVFRGSASTLVSRLADASPEVAARLPELIEQTATEETIPAIMTILDRMEPSTRRKLIGVLARFRTQEARDALLTLLQDGDGMIRRAAIEALPGFEPGDWTAHLKGTIDSPAFADRPLEEKKGLLNALTRLEGAKALGFLDALVGRRKWFETKKQEETRACAALALGEIDSEEAERALEKWGQDKSEAIRGAAHLAMNRKAQTVGTH